MSRFKEDKKEEEGEKEEWKEEEVEEAAALIRFPIYPLLHIFQFFLMSIPSFRLLPNV